MECAFPQPAREDAGTVSLIEIAKVFGGSETNVDPALVELKKVLPKIAAVGQPAAMPGLFQQGQCDVMYTNTQTVTTLKDRGVDIAFAVPETGATAFFTTLHIAKGSTAGDNAYRYIDTVVSQGVQSALMHAADIGHAVARIGQSRGVVTVVGQQLQGHR